MHGGFSGTRSLPRVNCLGSKAFPSWGVGTLLTVFASLVSADRLPILSPNMFHTFDYSSMLGAYSQNISLCTIFPKSDLIVLEI